MASYSPVYSAQFVVHHSGDPLVPFIVPDGYTAVVRDFTAYSAAGGAIVQLYIQDAAEAPALIVAQIGELGVAAYGQWTGRVVIPAPGIISYGITEVGAEAAVYVGGYLLRNVLT